MAVLTKPDALPLKTDDGGVIRVGGTRVTLDTVIQAFRGGAAAEEIVDRYPVLALADVYATIAHYLRHRSEVDEYLAEQAVAAAAARREAEALCDNTALRQRLLAIRRQP